MADETNTDDKPVEGVEEKPVEQETPAKETGQVSTDEVDERRGQIRNDFLFK